MPMLKLLGRHPPNLLASTFSILLTMLQTPYTSTKMLACQLHITTTLLLLLLLWTSFTKLVIDPGTHILGHLFLISLLPSLPTLIYIACPSVTKRIPVITLQAVAVACGVGDSYLQQGYPPCGLSPCFRRVWVQVYLKYEGPQAATAAGALGLVYHCYVSHLLQGQTAATKEAVTIIRPLVAKLHNRKQDNCVHKWAHIKHVGTCCFMVKKDVKEHA
jgi:hypothetical protein